MISFGENSNQVFETCFYCYLITCLVFRSNNVLTLKKMDFFKDFITYLSPLLNLNKIFNIVLLFNRFGFIEDLVREFGFCLYYVHLLLLSILKKYPILLSLVCMFYFILYYLMTFYVKMFSLFSENINKNWYLYCCFCHYWFLVYL